MVYIHRITVWDSLFDRKMVSLDIRSEFKEKFYKGAYIRNLRDLGFIFMPDRQSLEVEVGEEVVGGVGFMKTTMVTYLLE